MKKLPFHTFMILGLSSLVSAAVLLSNTKSPLFLKAGATYTYKHYNAIAPTDNTHGCVEFWVSCSDYSFLLEEPTEGTIVEGGDITDNPSFDWDSM